MIDSGLQTIVAKLQKLRALRRARERVRQLERELSGEPARAVEPPHVPEFLRQRAPLLIARDSDPRSTEQRAPAAVAHGPIGRAA